MMAERYRDFDQFQADVDNEPVRFKVAGEEFILPPQPSAKSVLCALRIRDEHGDAESVSRSDLMEMATTLLGDDNTERLLNTGITLDKLGEIVKWVFSVYNGEVEDDEGNPEAPENGAE